MPQRTLDWPRRIARSDRTPLAAGHGSFCLRRVHLGGDAFDCQPVRLAGCLLVLAREGSVILDGGEHSVLLQEGDAALVPPGRFKVTEIPRPCFTCGETLCYFFNPRALAGLMARREGVDEVAARIALPALPFYPVRRLGAALAAATAAGTHNPPADLRAVFTGLLAARPAITLTFLKHQLFVPRFRLCVFLDGHCLSKVDLKHIASRYAQGARAFRRESSNHLGLPVEQWLFRCRTELAQWWLRHTDRTEQEVAARLGYTDVRRFRGDMKRFGRFSPLELETLWLLAPSQATPETRLPFWFSSGEARAAKHRRAVSDLCTLAMLAPTRKAQQALLRKRDVQSRCGPALPPSEAGPTINLPPGAGDPVSEERATEPTNVIAWGAVEKWRAGGSSLIGELAAFAVAA